MRESRREKYVRAKARKALVDAGLPVPLELEDRDVRWGLLNRDANFNDGAARFKGEEQDRFFAASLKALRASVEKYRGVLWPLAIGSKRGQDEED